MLRNTVILILLVSVMAETFNKGLIIVDFLANRKYISENLCVNKSKPQMHCCGKCQLSKKMNQENKKDSNLPERKRIDEVLFCSEINVYQFNPEAINNIKLSRLDPISISSYYSDIFHPPQV
jgi:hypothetical protein